MINVIRNTFCIFKRNKEFIYLITIQPLLIFLLMSFLLPYSKTHNVAVADLSENQTVSQALENIEPGEFSDKVYTLDNRKLYKRTF